MALYAVAIHASFASSLADQRVVGNRSGAGTEAEECIGRRMPCAVPISRNKALLPSVKFATNSPQIETD